MKGFCEFSLLFLSQYIVSYQLVRIVVVACKNRLVVRYVVNHYPRDMSIINYVNQNIVYYVLELSVMRVGNVIFG